MARAATGRTTTQKGYGTAHQRARARVAPLVAAGRAVCSRCGLPIAPDAKWHLDHDDHDKSRYRGPAHKRCNEAAGGRIGGKTTAMVRRARKATMRAAAVTRLKW